jgi:hypothetical protein
MPQIFSKCIYCCLALMVVFYRHVLTVGKPITLHIKQYKATTRFPCFFINIQNMDKIFHRKGTNLNEVCILHSALIFFYTRSRS